jgi:hypothetical protein
LTTGTSLTLDHAFLTPKEGTDAVLCQASDTSAPYTDQHFKFKRALPSVNLRDINKLYFWYYPGHNIAGGAYVTLKVRLLAPDSSNYFELHDDLSMLQQWYWADLTLGEAAEYDVDEKPNGIWDKTGTPNWWNICGVEWEGTSNAAASGSLLFGLDKLYFYPERWVYTASDEDSIDDYYQQDAEYTDENLASTAQCEVRAKTLLYQLKDPVVRVNLTCAGNTNILLGDRVPVEIPNEGIDADFDIVAVDHNFTMKGWQTTASCVDSANTRSLPAANQGDAIRKRLNSLKLVTSELYQKVVS